MKVVLAIDGSAPSAVAVDLVSHVAWPAGTTIRIIQAIQTGADLFGGPWPAVAAAQADRVEAASRRHAESAVREAAARVARADLTAETGVLLGRASTAILDEARTSRADLIVVGGRGHGMIESMLLGSVSAEVVDHSATPVLVARMSTVDRIVLAWDGSSVASRAVEVLRRWPVFRKAAVCVVSVAEIVHPWWTGFPPADPDDLTTISEAADASRARHGELARTMAAELREAGLSAEADPREGDVAAEILHSAADFGADLIALGTRGRSDLERLVLGSVARNVLQHARWSVLLVPEPAAGTQASTVQGSGPASARPGARTDPRGSR
jgi:nucleotide-binding universal stress UspA family protein